MNQRQPGVDRLSTAALIVLTLCAVILTWERLQQHSENSESSGRAVVRDWQEFAAEGHSLGPKDAPVTIIAFSDCQCPFCAVLAQTLRSVRQRFGERVRIVVRHYPLPRHRRAEEAALAAECAAEQSRFGELHDTLFAWQGLLDTLDLATAAAGAGVADLPAFSQCLTSRRNASRVRADVEAGWRLRIRGTPTVLVNGHRFDGNATLTQLEAAVNEELQRTTEGGGRRSEIRASER